MLPVIFTGYSVRGLSGDRIDFSSMHLHLASNRWPLIRPWKFLASFADVLNTLLYMLGLLTNDKYISIFQLSLQKSLLSIW